MAVQLRNFDPFFKDALKWLDQFTSRVDFENARPTVWSKQQVADLYLIHHWMDAITNAVGEMAARVRDD